MVHLKDTNVEHILQQEIDRHTQSLMITITNHVLFELELLERLQGFMHPDYYNELYQHWMVTFSPDKYIDTNES